MRRFGILLASLLLVPAVAANHAVYLDRTNVMSCLLLVNASGVLVGVNCPGIQENVAAAEPNGASYRLTVVWTAVNADWGQLRAELVSCENPCPAPSSGVCLNNNCIGNPNPGGAVQRAATVSASPLVLEIPTDGPETRVQFTLQATGPVKALLAEQGVRYRLEHVG